MQHPAEVDHARHCRDAARKLLIAVLFTAAWLVPTGSYAIGLDAVVSPRWLKDHIGTPGLKVIEVSDEASFEFDGHIPGAASITKSDMRFQDADLALVHLSPEKLQEIIRARGINHSDGIVIYYKGGNINEILGAYYMFWLFHYLGHTNVAMLDRGWHGWLSAGGEVEKRAKDVATGDFVARPLAALKIKTPELYAIHDRYTVIDGRPASHFAGRKIFPGNTRYGRIAGSLNQPWEDYIKRSKDGLIYLDMTEVPALLKAGMITKSEPLLQTCFGGTGAAINYTLFYAHGYHNQRFHDAGLRRWNAQNLPLIRDAD